MSAVRRRRRSYDPRLRMLVHQAGGDELVRKLEIPRSTLAGWKQFPRPETVAADTIQLDSIRLQAKIAKLEHRLEVVTATMGLLLALLGAFGFQLDRRRFPAGDAKANLLRAIDRARSALPLRSVLRVLGLSSCRYAAWCRCARDFGWRRPRLRVYPCTPKEGIRTDRPDAMWHHDTTVIRIGDGRKVYLRAVIDNFSWRILAWWLGASPEPTSTAALLVEAAKGRTN